MGLAIYITEKSIKTLRNLGRFFSRMNGNLCLNDERRVVNGEW